MSMIDAGVDHANDDVLGVDSERNVPRRHGMDVSSGTAG